MIAAHPVFVCAVAPSYHRGSEFRMIAFFDSIADTVTILNYAIALELGPMIAAIVLISRTGSAITVELGNMKLHKEIESLEDNVSAGLLFYAYYLDSAGLFDCRPAVFLFTYHRIQS